MTKPNAPLKVTVGIASKGRPEDLAVMAVRLAGQSVAPHRVIYSVTGEEDLPARESLPDWIEIVIGSPGLCAQRNRILEAALEDSDVIAFFDDDYIPEREAVRWIAHAFAEHDDVAGFCGALLADGILGPGLELAEAEALVDAHDAACEGVERRLIGDREGLYGCNMAYRASAVGDTRFDETLPAYAWQEDTDFAGQIAAFGRTCASRYFYGVHRGVKRARTPGVKLGYAQIANPVYLMRKGTMSGRFARKLMVRNIIANHVKALRPEPWVDRAGRVRGNWIALRHWMTGKLHPSRFNQLS